MHIEPGAPEPSRALQAARLAARTWAQTPLVQRLAVVRRARHLIASRATAIAATVGHRPVRDTLVSEVLPLLDAMRFLERRAGGLLKTRKLRRGKPLWLFGVSAEIQRAPLGVLLILGPGNYPLFLPCTQAMQALVAGNAVCLKPAPGGESAAVALTQVLREAGLPADVLQVLEASAGPSAVRCKFDRIVLTGSAETGIKVLQAAAAQLTPSTLELSGCDAAYVMPGADVPLVARCLAYALALNGGATCIAPRRVFVLKNMAAELEGVLLALLPAIPDTTVPAPIAQRLSRLLDQAAQSGGRIVSSGLSRPALLADASIDMELLQQDIFAPWLALVPVPDMDTALEQSQHCPYALGASIFGPLDKARALARSVIAGSVCINDVIVPTADPRLPFGGSGRSGFGRTRGADGLLEMTALKAVSVRHGKLRPHLNASLPKDEARFAKMIRVLHGNWLGN